MGKLLDNLLQVVKRTTVLPPLYYLNKWRRRHEEKGATKKMSPHMFLFALQEGLLNEDVGLARDTEFFQKIRPGGDFKTSDFVREKLGGYTVDTVR